MVSTRYFPEASSVTFGQGVTYGLRSLLVMGKLVLHRSGIVESRLFAP